MIEIDTGTVWSHVWYDTKGASPLKNILDWGLKVEVPGAQYLYAYKSGQWDGKASLWEDYIDPSSQRHAGVKIRTGLVPRLISLLNQGGVAWRSGHDYRRLHGNQLQPTKVPLRTYQFDAVKAAFQNCNDSFGWWPQGVLALATGAGKTECAVAVYEMNPIRTVFLVHRKDLMVQAKERFEKYGHTVGVTGDGKFELRAGITIATMQTIHKIMQEHSQPSGRYDKLTRWMSGVQQVFFDECHLMASSLEKGNQFVDVADFVPAQFRWGLTATPFMRSQYDNLLLESVTGQALYRITTEELVAMGFLTPPKVTVKHVPGSMTVTMDWKKGRSNKARSAHWRKVEEKGIKFNEIRTRLIVDEIAKGPYPCLILVKTVEQAEFIKTLYSNATGLDLPFVSGKSATNDRRAAIQGLRSGRHDAIMATTVFDEGVDIPELRKVILASGGKSPVKLIQRVGRALRKAEGKTEAVIIDFNDMHHGMLEKHSKARIQTYKEQAFEVVYETR